MDTSGDETHDGAVAVAEEQPPPLAVHVDDPGTRAAPPDWWHREHPTFTALTGFFSGLAFATVLPGLFVAVVRALTDERTAEEAFPFVLLLLAVPVGLVAFPQTRRFGKYLAFGILIALLVIFGVGTVVFWLMMNYTA